MVIWTQHTVPPYGYECDESGALYLSYVEQSILRRIFQNKGKLSWKEVASQLNEKGFLTRTGKPFTKYSIRGVLESNKKADPFRDRVLEY
jgi:hypothetical protein